MKNFLCVVGAIALMITAVTVGANVGALTTATPKPYSGTCVEPKEINGVMTFVGVPCKGEEDRPQVQAPQKSIGVITFNLRTLSCDNIDYVTPWKIPGARPASECEWLYPGQEFAVWEIKDHINWGGSGKTAYCVSSMWLTGPVTDPVECRWVLPLHRGEAEFIKD